MKRRWWIGLVIVIVAAAAFYGYRQWKHSRRPPMKEWTVEASDFTLQFTSMGTITPKNKIKVTAPLSGRVDKILVEEGDEVRKGQVMALISSADRVAVVDSVQSGDSPKEPGWEEMYKPAPLRSPVNGRVISRTLVLGQTITQDTSLYEISDVLIVVSKVDESDIGKVRQGQPAQLTVDAFPDESIKAKVDRIGEQSNLTNNVNSYDVFLVPEEPFAARFKAGMSVSVQYQVRVTEKALTLPTWITEGQQRQEVELTVRDAGRGADGEAEKRKVKLGESNGDRVEVLSGLAAGDHVLYQPMEYTREEKNAPFGMGRRRPQK